MDLGFMQGRRPDPATAFRCSAQADAADLLADCVRGGEPIVVLTGAPGLGKTLVLDLALSLLGDMAPRVLRIEPPFPAPMALQQCFAEALRLPDPGAATPAGLAQALLLLEPPAPDMASMLVVLDGAEAASGPLLQYLWLMQSLTALGRPALQLLLAGRDALWRQLGEEPLAGLRRGVSARLALQPLAEMEAAALLQHVAQQRGRHIDADAAAAMLDAAAGVPGRLIGLLDAACVGLRPRRPVTLAAVRRPRIEPGAAREQSSPYPASASAARPAGRAVAWIGRRPWSTTAFAVMAGLLLLVATWWALPGGRSAAPQGGMPRQTVVASSAAFPPVARPPTRPVQRTAPAKPIPRPPAEQPEPPFAPPQAVAVAPVAPARNPVAPRSRPKLDVAALRWAAFDVAALGTPPPPSLFDSAQVAGFTPPTLPAPAPVRIAPAAPPATPAPPPAPALAAVPDPATAAAPMLVLADATAPRVVLMYPRGDPAARARAADAAQTLRAQGVNVSDPQPAPRSRRPSGIGYFFADDLDSAREVARKLGERVDPDRIEALPMPSAPPPPGTLEILLAGH